MGSARRLASAGRAALVGLCLGLGAVAAWRLSLQRRAATALEAKAGADAGADAPQPPPLAGGVERGPSPCRDASLGPAPLLVDLEGSELFVVADPSVLLEHQPPPRREANEPPHGACPGPPVKLSGEGAKAVRVGAGLFALRARSPAGAAAQLFLAPRAFEAGLVLVALDGRSFLFVPLEARCASCELSASAPTLAFDAAAPADGALERARSALERSDWRSAAAALRGVRPAERGARFRLHAAAVHALAGAWDEARRALTDLEAMAGRDDPEARSHAALLARWRRAEAEAARSRAALQAERGRLALLRWNVLTERFVDLGEAFASARPGTPEAAAEGLASSARERLDQLSLAVTAASEAADVARQELAVGAAVALLEGLVRDLRALAPRDCAWQARVTAAQAR